MPSQPVWIGGKSVETWGDWSWADGASWSFTNWAGSQPKRDDMGMGDENCVTINGYTGAGQWCFWSLIFSLGGPMQWNYAKQQCDTAVSKVSFTQ